MRNILFYIITLSVCFAIIYNILIYSHLIDEGRVIDESYHEVTLTLSAWEHFSESKLQNMSSPFAVLLLQIISILIVTRIFGFFCKKIRQPLVIGEIIAGIFLGPSFIGTYFPEISGYIFPTTESLNNLKLLSGVGLILFMFVVGMELDLKALRNKSSDAVIISHASIIFPFTIGIVLSYFTYVEFAPSGTSYISFALFIGIAMSITAFPVLARIIFERGLTKTKIGAIASTCAAVDDISAWCILAIVIAIIKQSSTLSALYTIVSAILYIIAMIKIVQPCFERFSEKYIHEESMSDSAIIIAIFFIILLISSYITEVIGIHALFGAFMAGVIMPSNNKIRAILIGKIKDITLLMFLPLFFVYTGLRTQIGLLDDWYLYGTTLTIIAIAIVGKFIGSAMASRFVHYTWRESLIIGALMNTRGLMELVVLNIGYDLGILSAEIYTMFVLMALFTTFMTVPLLNFIDRKFPEQNT